MIDFITSIPLSPKLVIIIKNYENTVENIDYYLTYSESREKKDTCIETDIIHLYCALFIGIDQFCLRSMDHKQ